jgi:hypothetical protein
MIRFQIKVRLSGFLVLLLALLSTNGDKILTGNRRMEKYVENKDLFKCFMGTRRCLVVSDALNNEIYVHSIDSDTTMAQFNLMQIADDFRMPRAKFAGVSEVIAVYDAVWNSVDLVYVTLGGILGQLEIDKSGWHKAYLEFPDPILSVTSIDVLLVAAIDTASIITFILVHSMSVQTRLEVPGAKALQYELTRSFLMIACDDGMRAYHLQYHDHKYQIELRYRYRIGLKHSFFTISQASLVCDQLFWLVKQSMVVKFNAVTKKMEHAMPYDRVYHLSPGNDFADCQTGIMDMYPLKKRNQTLSKGRQSGMLNPPVPINPMAGDLLLFPTIGLAELDGPARVFTLQRNLTIHENADASFTSVAWLLYKPQVRVGTYEKLIDAFISKPRNR